MPPQLTSTWIVLLGVGAAGGLGWLQWLILKRLVGRPNQWVATSVVGAAVSTPLGTGMVLDSLLKSGLPPAAAVPVGLGLLLAQVVLGAVLVAAVAWGMAASERGWPDGEDLSTLCR